jgi:hypothetical protein
MAVPYVAQAWVAALAAKLTLLLLHKLDKQVSVLGTAGYGAVGMVETMT